MVSIFLQYTTLMFIVFLSLKANIELMVHNHVKTIQD